MFNDYIWQTYLNAGGRKVAKMFESNLSPEGYSEEYADYIEEFYKVYGFYGDEVKDELLDLFDFLADYEFSIGTDKKTIKSVMKELCKDLKETPKTSMERVFLIFISCLECYSTLLTIENPDLFVPYYFQCNFNILEKIATEFGIDLPPVPIKRDYEGRFYYYGKICEALFDFRKEHNMTPFELCAFLYDFAPKYVGGVDSYIVKELPEPKSAFFIGGNASDEELADDENIIVRWQCSDYAKAGDIAVMYLRTPISSVDSVWRCVSDGFVDPLFLHYKCAYITKPEKINRISQKQLEADEIFSQYPLVRKNMQGINGMELMPSQYNHLLDMAKSKLKRLDYSVTKEGIELLSEVDVENKLIKPLLEQLGYNNRDYIQQHHIEIGNHNAVEIPDFLLMVDDTNGHQSAFAVVEAKFKITNAKDFNEAKKQARSYARQTIAKYSVIADMQKVWVSTYKDDFEEDVFIATWNELNIPDNLSRLNKLIGKDTYRKLNK